jgi:endonuclease YncB( thermonuclease family)
MPQTFGPYPARVHDLHDGDTVYLDIDLGFDHLITARDWSGSPRLACRVYGINAPELSTAAGKTALAYAQTLLTPGMIVHVTSHGWDKYGGRFDGTITLPDGTDFATLMIQSGNAVTYP